jgi:hypothetical protein
MTNLNDYEEFAPILKRLDKDLREIAKRMSPLEARFMVDTYYAIQRDRIRTGNRYKRTLVDAEPNALISHIFKQAKTQEETIAVSLDVYTANHPVGSWLRSNIGIGPVIAAGLIGYIPIEKSRYAGQLWSFAGLNPTVVWKKGEKRPWNANLKVLCWKLGESFVKFSNTKDKDGNPIMNYGTFYQRRKVVEISRNERGLNAEIAKQLLEKFDWKNDTVAKAKLLEGKLSDGHIHARAKRYAVKLFLSHMHETWWTYVFGERPELCYPISKLGHKTYIPPLVEAPWMVGVPLKHPPGVVTGFDV